MEGSLGVTKHGTIYKDHTGNIKVVLQVGIAQKNLRIMKGICGEFGLGFGKQFEELDNIEEL